MPDLASTDFVYFSWKNPKVRRKSKKQNHSLILQQAMLRIQYRNKLETLLLHQGTAKTRSEIAKVADKARWHKSEQGIHQKKGLQTQTQHNRKTSYP